MLKAPENLTDKTPQGVADWMKTILNAIRVQPPLSKTVVDNTLLIGFEAEAKTRGYAQISRFMVDVVEEDYLECRRYDPDTKEAFGETVYVAKPEDFRKDLNDGKTHNPFDQQSYEITYDPENPKFRRTITTETLEEEQRITPSYYDGEIIVAFNGRTGLEVDGKPVVWQDKNQNGKSWAEDN